MSARREPIEEATKEVYQNIIDDVVSGVKAEFVQEGVDETVLDELRELWEANLAQTGVLGEYQVGETQRIIKSLVTQPKLEEDTLGKIVQHTEALVNEQGMKDLQQDGEESLIRKRKAENEADGQPLSKVTATPSEAAPSSAAHTSLGDDDGEDLNDLDDLAGVDDDEIDESSVKDVIVGMFDKVHRSKNKWKVNLKDCVVTIKGRDYLLKKATGDMSF